MEPEISTVKAVYDKIIIRPFEEVNRTKSGIYVPVNDDNPHAKGQVVSVGLDCKTVLVGDTVLYHKLSGTDFSHRGEKYATVRENEILAILQ